MEPSQETTTHVNGNNKQGIYGVYSHFSVHNGIGGDYFHYSGHNMKQKRTHTYGYAETTIITHCSSMWKQIQPKN